MNLMKTVRWGISGPGAIANKFAQAIKNVSESKLCAVASRSLQRGEEFAKKYNIEKVFESYEQMAKFDDVDAIYISTAHPFHKSCAELFIKNGKHILCEKPICVNEKEALYLKSLAKENGVFLMEAMWTAFLPAIDKAKALVSDGKIGTVRKIEASFCYSTDQIEEPKLFDNSLAGGSLLDVGVYGLYFASLFADGAPSEIKSFSRVENGVDLQTEILLEYPNGIIASVSSAVDLEKSSDAIIYGTKGSIKIPEFYTAQKLFCNFEDKEEEFFLPFAGNGFEEEIAHASWCIINGKTESDVHPLSKSISILKQMDIVRKENLIVYPSDKNI